MPENKETLVLRQARETAYNQFNNSRRPVRQIEFDEGEKKDTAKKNLGELCGWFNSVPPIEEQTLHNADLQDRKDRIEMSCFDDQERKRLEFIKCLIKDKTRELGDGDDVLKPLPLQLSAPKTEVVLFLPSPK